MITLAILCLVIALVFFVAAAINRFEASRLQLIAIGLAFSVAAQLAPLVH